MVGMIWSMFPQIYLLPNHKLSKFFSTGNDDLILKPRNRFVASKLMIVTNFSLEKNDGQNAYAFVP